MISLLPVSSFLKKMFEWCKDNYLIVSSVFIALFLWLFHRRGEKITELQSKVMTVKRLNSIEKIEGEINEKYDNLRTQRTKYSSAKERYRRIREGLDSIK